MTHFARATQIILPILLSALCNYRARKIRARQSLLQTAGNVSSRLMHSFYARGEIVHADLFDQLIAATENSFPAIVNSAFVRHGVRL